MSDLATMVWKETAEFMGNRRFLRVFAIAVLAMGILPALTFSHHGSLSLSLGTVMRGLYVLFATVVVVAQTAPDLVLHERVGHTLDYLLTTRLSDRAIFGAKVLVAWAVGYIAAMIALAIQLIAASILGGQGFHWLFLGIGMGRVVVFGITAGLSLYVAVVGTFVALRVGEQRAAYMVTILSVGILLVPFFTRWIPIHLTISWMSHAAIILGALAVALGILGMRLFRRDMLVLYLQE